MKNILLLSILSISLFSCKKGSVETLTGVVKPAVVFSKNVPKSWDNFTYGQSLVLLDANGVYVSLPYDHDLVGLTNKYNIGDTIK